MQRGEDSPYRITNSLSDAFKDPSLENRLYTMYTRVGGDSCTALYSALGLSASIEFNPQIVLREGPRRGDQPPDKDSSSGSKKNPDFARVVVFNTHDPDFNDRERELLDLWEVKPLVGDEHDPLMESAQAETNIILHVEQVYEAAMTAFRCYQSWEKVTVLLIIGVFFTQFVWTRPSDTDVLATSAPPSLGVGNRPNKDKKPDANVDELVKEQLEIRTARYNRRMPQIFFYNACVIKKVAKKGSKELFKRYTLSDNFIDALNLPVQQSKHIVHQPSWFSHNKGRKPLSEKVSISPTRTFRSLY